jgi:hypothetical protein
MANNKRLAKLKKLVNVERTENIGIRSVVWIGTMKKGGAKVAVMPRRCDQIYRGIYPTITEARREGALAWLLESNGLSYLYEQYGVKYLLLAVRETGDIYISRMEEWVKPERAYTPDPGARKTSSLNRYSFKVLPVDEMICLPGDIELNVR